jgi:hypothetical protein
VVPLRLDDVVVSLLRLRDCLLGLRKAGVLFAVGLFGEVVVDRVLGKVEHLVGEHRGESHQVLVGGADGLDHLLGLNEQKVSMQRYGIYR